MKSLFSNGDMSKFCGIKSMNYQLIFTILQVICDVERKSIVPA